MGTLTHLISTTRPQRSSYKQIKLLLFLISPPSPQKYPVLQPINSKVQKTNSALQSWLCNRYSFIMDAASWLSVAINYENYVNRIRNRSRHHLRYQMPPWRSFPPLDTHGKGGDKQHSREMNRKRGNKMNSYLVFKKTRIYPIQQSHKTQSEWVEVSREPNQIFRDTVTEYTLPWLRYSILWQGTRKQREGRCWWR